MATGLLVVLDDIATVLDDIALLTKVATRKTAGVLSDDLALNAEQVAGVRAERELPVVFAVFKGSLINKLILVPVALALSAVAPWAVLPLLMAGGLFLCYEGAEKLVHRLRPGHGPVADAEHAALTAALIDPDADLAALERDKIKGAVRTDFILSAEIVVITLGIVTDAAFGTRVAVLTTIALVMTSGVYGLVALIVKLDDMGLYLSRLTGSGAVMAGLRGLGRGLVGVSPGLMRALSVIGMVAMFLVGGGIIAHGIPGLHDLAHHLIEPLHGLAVLGGPLIWLAPLLINGAVGILAGLIVLAVVGLVQRLRGTA